MSRLKQVRTMVNEGNERINKALQSVPIADEKSKNLARDLSIKAKDNIGSARDNYKTQRYWKAAEDLQQAVEKISKAHGLLLGNLEPTEACMKQISHDSFMALIIGFWRSYPKLIKSNANMFLEISKLNHLDPGTMWISTLELDQSNKWVRSALNDIRQPSQFGEGLRSFMAFSQNSFKTVGLLDSGMVHKMKLSASLGLSGEKLFSLGVLTCWHLEPARYPPIGRYWRSDAYQLTAPYIREMPLLIACSSARIDALMDATVVLGEILGESLLA